MGMRRRLHDGNDLRRYVADILLRLDADKIEESKARALFQGCGVLRLVIETSALEDRVAALEAAQPPVGK